MISGSETNLESKLTQSKMDLLEPRLKSEKKKRKVEKVSYSLFVHLYMESILYNFNQGRNPEPEMKPFCHNMHFDLSNFSFLYQYDAYLLEKNMPMIHKIVVGEFINLKIFRQSRLMLFP